VPRPRAGISAPVLSLNRVSAMACTVDELKYYSTSERKTEGTNTYPSKNTLLQRRTGIIPILFPLPMQLASD
jgi:hypothetical protein